MSQSPPGGQYRYPDRSTLIVVLGILGIVLCPFCGPIAWILGKGDLARIDAGTMDPKGRDTVKSGMICGIIGTVLLGIDLLIGLVMLVILILGLFAVGAAAASGGP